MMCKRPCFPLHRARMPSSHFWEHGTLSRTDCKSAYIVRAITGVASKRFYITKQQIAAVFNRRSLEHEHSDYSALQCTPVAPQRPTDELEWPFQIGRNRGIPFVRSSVDLLHNRLVPVALDAQATRLEVVTYVQQFQLDSSTALCHLQACDHKGVTSVSILSPVSLRVALVGAMVESTDGSHRRFENAAFKLTNQSCARHVVNCENAREEHVFLHCMQVSPQVFTSVQTTSTHFQTQPQLI